MLFTLNKEQQYHRENAYPSTWGRPEFRSATRAGNYIVSSTGFPLTALLQTRWTRAGGRSSQLSSVKRVRASTCPGPCLSTSNLLLSVCFVVFYRFKNIFLLYFRFIFNQTLNQL